MLQGLPEDMLARILDSNDLSPTLSPVPAQPAMPPDLLAAPPEDSRQLDDLNQQGALRVTSVALHRFPCSGSARASTDSRAVFALLCQY